jgi:hypothetical protein
MLDSVKSVQNSDLVAERRHPISPNFNVLGFPNLRLFNHIVSESFLSPSGPRMCSFLHKSTNFHIVC